ncbi:conjugal transfer protein [Galbibacter sp. BG1]|nr:conjugal transfer protein [Galbibacter sp. BG1]QLE03133.1 conjugal transfer protein [Galbibacter sp. BG1]
MRTIFMYRKNGCLWLLLMAISCMPTQALCQGMPVYDNTNFISLAKQLIESGKQTSQMVQTVKFLKQQKDNLEKVNSVIRQLKALRELTANNERLFNMVRNDLRRVLDSPYIKAEEVDRISASFDAIMVNAVESLAYVEQILSSDLLKMGDSDRLRLLQQQEEDSREMVAEIEGKVRRYEELISFRKMQAVINTRAARN